MSARSEHDAGRLENLVGAFGLRVVTEVDAALDQETGMGGRHPAALISLLNYADGCSLETLQRGLAMSQPGSVHLVGRLTARGLVRRERDGRTTRVRLTARGRSTAVALLRRRTATISRQLDGLDADERATFEHLLHRLLAAQPVDGDGAHRTCRLCSPTACRHPSRCPVTQAVERQLG